ARAAAHAGRSRRTACMAPPLLGFRLWLGRLGNRDGRGHLGLGRGLGLAADAAGAAALERLVGGDAAEARAREGRVRAPLAVGENRPTPAGEVVAVAAAAESDVGLGL